MAKEKALINAPIISDEIIESILHGSDDSQGLKYIDINYASPKAKLFFRSPDDKHTHVVEDTFSPFLWFKGFDFQTDWAWESFAVPLDRYDSSTGTFLISKNGNLEVFQIDDVNYRFERPTYDKEYVIISKYLHTIPERRRLAYAKYQEYGILFEDAHTRYIGQPMVERMEKGFKTLVHILPPEEPVQPSNPLFWYNKNGKKNKIIGSYANLQQFFLEGGIDISKKSGVFLNYDGFLNFWETSTTYQKLYFYIHLGGLTNYFFSSQPDLNLLCEFWLENYNEKIKKAKVLSYTIEFYQKNLDKLVIDSNKLLACFTSEDEELKWSFDTDLVKQMYEQQYTFETKKGFKTFNEKLIENSIDIFYGEERLFFTLPPIEQYMIQKGKRLYKGFESYEELNIMTMDIETEAQPAYSHIGHAALSPKIGRIFKIGIFQNDGYNNILTSSSDNEELEAIINFFQIVAEKKPEILLTYNGEGFDWPFIVDRFCILNNVSESRGIEMINEIMAPYYENLGANLWLKRLFWRTDTQMKVGGGSEKYRQTNILGINVCDTMFAVKRAAAIDKNIPNHKLKDNIKYAKLNKQNRVYVPGDEIGTIMRDVFPYYLHNTNGSWLKHNKELTFVKTIDISKIIVDSGGRQVYENSDVLLVHPNNKLNISNAVWENDNEDFVAVLKKLAPKFRKIVFSLDNLPSTNLKEFGIWMRTPENQELYQVDFSEYKKVTGDEIIHQYLIADLEETYALDCLYSQASFEVSKWLPTSYQRATTIGGASVWKSLLAGWNYNQKIAIPLFDEPREYPGALVGMLSTGWHGKSVKFDFSSLYPALFIEHCITPNIDISGIYKPFMGYGLKTRLTYKKLKGEAEANGDFILAKKYDIKQLPLKILINSFYGMMGAAAVSPFADIFSAAWITSNGRQWLRHTIKWFSQFLFKIINCHTDGIFFTFDEVNLDRKYIGKGLNWLVKKDKEYNGLEAYVAEFNDLFMVGRMGLDIDEIVESVMSLSKGNYVYYKQKKDKKTGEIKDDISFVGGGIIKKSQSPYIVEFFEKNLITLMKGEGKNYIQKIITYVNEIFNYKIPLMSIANKSRVKKTVAEYIEHMKTTNKNGRALNRQPHMELMIKNNINPEIGEWIYYVNTGTFGQKDSANIITSLGDFMLDNTTYTIHQIENLDKNQIYNLLNKEYLNGNFILNKKHNSFEEAFANIEDWSSIQLKSKFLKTKGNVITFSSKHFELNCQLVDENTDTASVLYNQELYVRKFLKAAEPLLLAYNKKVRTAFSDLSVSQFINDNGETVLKLTEIPLFLNSDFELINKQPNKETDEDQLTDILTIQDEEALHWIEAIEKYNCDSESYLIQKK